MTAAAFSPDGATLATADETEVVRLWDAATGRQRALTLFHRHNRIEWLAFSPDGRRLYSLDDAGLYAWDAATANEVFRPVGFHWPTCAAVSPDGMRLATGDSTPDGSNVVCIWDAPTGRLLATTPPHWGRVTAVTFSHDGRSLASACDGYVRVFDAATAVPRTKSLGFGVSHKVALALSPDDRRLFGGGDGVDNAVWDAATGKEILRLAGCDSFTSAAFSPDGQTLATGGSRYPHLEWVLLWNLKD